MLPPEVIEVSLESLSEAILLYFYFYIRIFPFYSFVAVFSHRSLRSLKTTDASLDCAEAATEDE